MLQHFTDEADVGFGQLIALVLSLDGNWVGQPASFLSLSLPRKLSILLSSLQQGARPVLRLSGPQIPVTHTHTTRACSTILPKGNSGTSILVAVGGRAYGRGGSTLLLSHIQGWLACIPNNRVSSSAQPRWVQSLLLCVRMLVRLGPSSPTLMTLGPALSLNTSGNGWGGWHLSLTHATTLQMPLLFSSAKLLHILFFQINGLFIFNCSFSNFMQNTMPQRCFELQHIVKDYT